ncbi:Putative multidrug export ATP-binding/permease protein (plasmid) [Clostridium felsineum DSM 794]|nr:ABC transporter ATP-binding protein [Clostridium felsineum]URZ18746.1 Putative multidrug export ATP-binding/permease protein [Clostridium felsineum DSM 794]
MPKQNITIKDIIKSFKYWPRLLSLLWGVSKSNLIIIIVLTLINGLTPTLSLLASQHLINEVQIHMNKYFAAVLTAFIVFIIISLVTDFFGGIVVYFQTVYQKVLIYKLNVTLMEKANSLSLSDFENSEIYDKLSRAKNQVSYRPYQILNSILTVMSSIVTLVSSMLVVLAWKPWIIIVLIIFPVISSIYTLKVGQLEFMIQWKRAPKERRAWYLSYLLTNDQSFKEIKLYGIGNHILKKYKDLNKEFYDQDKYVAKKRTGMIFFSNFMEQVSGDITLFFIIWSAFMGKILMGSTVGLIRAVSLVQSNVKTFISTFFDMYENNLFIEQLFEFLDVPASKLDMITDGGITVENIETVEFKNIYFKYPSQTTETLKNINLKINAGENIALVGKNGSGKTTLIKLLCGLYEITSGDILINGISIKDINIIKLREKIATVFQDFLRYEMTVRDNIGLGNLELINEDDKLKKVALDAGIYDAIEKMPKKFDTQLGMWFKEGTQFSGGQWQKIALARAFIRKAELIILDEPSSALDPLSEREMFDKFLQLTDRKIGLFITHRFINAKYATRIVVLDKGEIVEEGTHEELMKIGGQYKSLYDVQYNIYENQKVDIS